jgi:hypothetical protein
MGSKDMAAQKHDRLQRIDQVVADHIADTGRLPSTTDIIQATGHSGRRVREDLKSLVKEGRLVVVYEAAKNPTIYMPSHMYDGLLRQQKVPEWMTEFILPRSSMIRESIRAQQDELAELHRVEALLYATGRGLEEAVGVSMNKLEFGRLELTYEDPDRWDLSFEHEHQFYICDAKGKTKWVDKGDVAQLSQWLQKYVDENPHVDPETVVGVLIVNHFRDLPPSERWPDEPANAPISDAAERYLGLGRLKYLTTVDLFDVAKDVVDAKTRPRKARAELVSRLRSNTALD